MALRNQPYLPLYVQDFLTDEKLIECSAESTGVYIRIMCIMHKSNEYGTVLLKQNDKQNESISLNFALKLSKYMPYPINVVEKSIIELVNEGCLTIEGDKLLQKRMVKDNLLSIKRSEAGHKGGINSKFAQAKSQANAQAKHQANTEYEYEDEIVNESINESKDINTNNTITPKEKKPKEEKPLWKTNYDVYLDESEDAYNDLIDNKEYIDYLEKLYPGINIKKSLYGCLAYWTGKEGWQNKKSRGIKEICWRSTYTNSLKDERNRIKYTQEELKQRNKPNL